MACSSCCAIPAAVLTTTSPSAARSTASSPTRDNPARPRLRRLTCRHQPARAQQMTWSSSCPISASRSSPPASRWPSSSSRRTWTSAAPAPLVANARLTRQGYLLHYSGSALLQHLLPLAHAFHIVPAGLEGMQGNGAADYNLTVQGDWLLPLADTDHPAPLSDRERLPHPAQRRLSALYLAEPVHIVTATATISPAELRWNGITATLGATHFTGSLRIPLPCLAACQRHFDLTAANLNLGALTASLRGEDEGMVQELLNRVRSRSPGLAASRWHRARRAPEPRPGRNRQRLRGSRPARRQTRSALARRPHPRRNAARHRCGRSRLLPQLRRGGAVAPRQRPELAGLLKEHWGPGLLDLACDLTMSGASSPASAVPPKARCTGTGPTARCLSSPARPSTASIAGAATEKSQRARSP